MKEITGYILIDHAGAPWRGYNGRIGIYDEIADARMLCRAFSTKDRPLVPVQVEVRQLDLPADGAAKGGG